MARFGGYARFGGTAHYGGASPLAVRYYRILKTMMLPGCWSTEDGTLINNMLFGDSVILDHAKTQANRIWAEIFPHTMDETLEQWEAFLSVKSLPAATRQDRKTAVVERWRGGQPSTLAGIRAALAPFLNPEYSINNAFDAEDDWRFDGTITASSGQFYIAANTGTSRRWDATSFNPTLSVWRVPAPGDDFEITATPLFWTLVDGSAIGLVLYDDALNATWYGLDWSGGAREQMVVSTIQAGVYTTAVLTASATPTDGYPIRLRREGSTLSFYYGATEAALALVGSIPLAHGCRYFGFYAANDGAAVATSSVNWGGNFKLQFDTAENNVDIWEMRESQTTTTAPSTASLIYQTFVHRRPSDAGSYDLVNAQRLADRLAQGHAPIIVGESVSFETDDPYSLTDRDLLGV